MALREFDGELAKLYKELQEAKLKTGFPTVEFLKIVKQMYDEDVPPRFIDKAEDYIYFKYIFPKPYHELFRKIINDINSGKFSISYVQKQKAVFQCAKTWKLLEGIFSETPNPSDNELLDISNRLKIDAELTRKWFDTR